MEPAVDFVIRGEGEAALPLLADAIKQGKTPDTVPGICYRKKDGTLLISPPTRISDAHDIPLPHLDFINRKFYQRHGLDSLVITTSRGCPMACSYCATNRKSWMGFRRRPVSAVLDEIQSACVGRRIGFIDFEDEHLTLSSDRFLELMAGIRALFGDNGPELRAMNGLFPPSLTQEIIQAMKASGFKALNLSLGSANKDQLRRFGRPDVRDAFDAALTCARKEGLSAVGYILVAAPDQDPLTSVDDLLFLAQRPILAGVSVFYPAPGSSDYQRCRDLGLLPDSFSAMGSTALPIDHRTSRQDAVTLLRLGRILNFMKGLVAAGIPIPCAAPLNTEKISGEEIDPKGREQLGLRVLSAFLQDGRIRGVDMDGQVYFHHVSQVLCDRFAAGIRKTWVAGCG
ncbi:radical SAM protein, partial [Desulfosarcina sp. OttesenSCG-928-A07]|nr:radical SAM protein [Desulfosarcina sp. OttesenSCG-928-A07]